ncbi:MAG TPA: DUF4375 domain-containing protein [Candidatus Babeliaceae bacterium]|nr:DUF4375 domain-containing protein [Candidatus Babeliaceae bacterium]
MKSKFLPVISKETYNAQLNDYHSLCNTLVEPLHEKLYQVQTFDLLDDLSEGQQLLVSYSYVESQVSNGGFIQLIQNGYVGLLLDMPGWLYKINAPEMAKVIDDALKVYVLNRELLSKKTTLEEFALLYQELKEFEEIDRQFHKLNEDTISKMMKYAITHIDEFAIIAG